LRAARDAASAEHAEAARRLEAAQRKAVGLRERGAGPSLDAARRAEDAARIRRGEVAALATIAAAARERAAARGVIADELAVVDAAVGADRAAIAVATAARDAARGAVAELDHSVATLRTIAGYGHARTELIDGEPCPLCGARTDAGAAQCAACGLWLRETRSAKPCPRCDRAVSGGKCECGAILTLARLMDYVEPSVRFVCRRCKQPYAVFQAKCPDCGGGLLSADRLKAYGEITGASAE